MIHETVLRRASKPTVRSNLSDAGAGALSAMGNGIASDRRESGRALVGFAVWRRCNCPSRIGRAFADG